MLPTNPRIREGITLQRAGDVATAAKIYKQVLQDDPQNAEALHYLGLAQFQQGSLEEAEKNLRDSARAEPGNANTWSDLGMVLIKVGKVEDALPAFTRALEIAPDHRDALNNFAQALRQLGRFEQAKPLLERLVGLAPNVAGVHYALADVHHKSNDIEGAIDIYQRALQLDPADRRIRLGLGDAYESVGNFRQAQMQYLAVLRREPDSPLALARLLQMRDATPAADLVERAQKMADDPNTPEDGRIRLNVALGYYYDRNKNFDEAFRRLKQGCDAEAQREPFDSGGYSRAIDTLIEVLTSDFFAAAQTADNASDRPIFIVGMPRSGTTLTEQILASHSRVAAGGELSSLLRVSFQVQSLSSTGEPYPRGLQSISKASLQQMAQTYLDDIDNISATAGHVTDKLPFNFMHLGVIALLFPNAKIIHCRRNPMDNCLSCYFTSFADQIRFANRLDTLGHYYRDYERLMRHWHQVLPITIYDLQYEDLVGGTEPEIRALLDYCGLDFEEACLAFYETQRGVRTPSRWQVRQPIYTGSVQRWKNYETQLQPLLDILAPVLDENVG